LREALRELEEEGLVVNIPFRGAFVSTIDRRSIDELCSFRNLIERFAVQRVIDLATDEDLARLRAIIERMEEHADQDDVDAVDHDDIAFHTTICQLADHRLLLQVWQTYAPQIQRAMALRNKINRDAHRIVALHRPILDAILRRDAAAAQACYAEHGTDLVATLFRQDDDPPTEQLDPVLRSAGATVRRKADGEDRRAHPAVDDGRPEADESLPSGSRRDTRNF
jgi:DNA-binding GntR family transcriptional regulator